MINQLRIYGIHEENKAAFHDRFRDHASRIMARHGFRLQAMWEAGSGDDRTFVYLLAWRDEAEMKAQWASFMADEEWIEIKRETADTPMVRGIDEMILRATDYSAPIGVSS